MISTCLTSLIISLSLVSIFCQTTQPYGALSNSQSVRDELGIALKNGVQNAYSMPVRYEGIKGTPFYYDEWNEGIICLSGDSAIVENKNVKLKFDSYSNELWILNKKDSLIAFSKDIFWFEIKSTFTTERFNKFPINDWENPLKFYNTLHAGQTFIFVKEIKKNLKRADYVDKGMSVSGKPYDRFEEDNDYYLGQDKNAFEKVKLNFKSIQKNLPKKIQKSLKAYCKKKDLDGKLTEEQAIEVILQAEILMSK